MSLNQQNVLLSLICLADLVGDPMGMGLCALCCGSWELCVIVIVIFQFSFCQCHYQQKIALALLALALRSFLLYS